MKIYEKPWYYIAFHMMFGFVAVWYPAIGLLALAWQLAQYVTKTRIFAVEMKLEKGNSAEHTLLKLGEIALGYMVGSLIKRLLEEKYSFAGNTVSV